MNIIGLTKKVLTEAINQVEPELPDIDAYNLDLTGTKNN